MLRTLWRRIVSIPFNHRGCSISATKVKKETPESASTTSEDADVEAITSLSSKPYNYDEKIRLDWWHCGVRHTAWAKWGMMRDWRRRKLAAEYDDLRIRMRAILRNDFLPRALKEEMSNEMRKLPHYCHPHYLKNCCQMTARRRGNVVRYRLSRFMFRDMADHAKYGIGFPRHYWVNDKFVLAVHCASVFFLNAPLDVKLPREDTILASDLANVQTALLGLDVEAPKEWLNSGNIWRRPEAIVVFDIAVPKKNIEPSIKATKTYKLEQDAPIDFGGVWMTIEQEYADSHPVLAETSAVGVSGSPSHMFEHLALNQTPTLFETTETAEQTLKNELAAVRMLMDWLSKHPEVRDGVPDFYTINFEALSWLDDPPSEASYTAAKSVSSIIEEASKAFRSLYGDNYVIQVVSTTGAKSRKPRAVRRKTKVSKQRKIQAAGVLPPTRYGFFDENYAVIFNICLWLVIGFASTILYIAVGMWCMDPGRESIVYRMTMTRAKKD